MPPNILELISSTTAPFHEQLQKVLYIFLSFKVLEMEKRMLREVTRWHQRGEHERYHCPTTVKTELKAIFMTALNT